MLRRREPDPAAEAAWDAFCRFAKALDQGSRALLSTVPSARHPGVPLEVAVGGFLAGIEAARAELPGWAHPEIAAEHAKAVAALDAAEAAARRLPVSAGGLEFEHRNERLGDVLDELVDIEPAEQALRALRRRPRRAGRHP
jgi:hypothetical protein